MAEQRPREDDDTVARAMSIQDDVLYPALMAVRQAVARLRRLSVPERNVTGQRFIVTELEGYLGNSTSPGLSCHVIDTMWNKRLVATYRTDGTVQGANRKQAWAIRAEAHAHAARLNETYG